MGRTARKDFHPERNSRQQFKSSPYRRTCESRTGEGLEPKKLEALSGDKQPIIARMERGSSIPQLDTVLKVLAPLGKTLAIVPLNKTK